MESAACHEARDVSDAEGDGKASVALARVEGAHAQSAHAVAGAAGGGAPHLHLIGPGNERRRCGVVERDTGPRQHLRAVRVDHVGDEDATAQEPFERRAGVMVGHTADADPLHGSAIFLRHAHLAEPPHQPSEERVGPCLAGLCLRELPSRLGRRHKELVRRVALGEGTPYGQLAIGPVGTRADAAHAHEDEGMMGRDDPGLTQRAEAAVRPDALRERPTDVV